MGLFAEPGAVGLDFDRIYTKPALTGVPLGATFLPVRSDISSAVHIEKVFQIGTLI